MSQFFKHLFENEKMKQIKKSDWIVLALLGVLLLVITLPGGEKETTQELGRSEVSQAETAEENKRTDEEAYVAYLEEKMEAVLSKMDGVGEVAVMITVSDAGEHVVEKDESLTKNTTMENDGTGGSRSTAEQKTEEQTIYVENGSQTYPYVQKEKKPTVEGVVVVAEGAANARVVSDISETVQALLPVEVHRIKVVKMESKEE